MQKWALLTLLCLGISTFVEGTIDDRIDNLENKMKQISTVTAAGTLGVLFATAEPDLFTQGEHLFLQFDLLYWQAKVGGTEYAYSLDPLIDQNSHSLLYPLSGQVKRSSFEGDWGLKIGLGHNPFHDEWRIGGLYTYFRAKSSHASTKPSPSALIPLNLHSLILASKAKSELSLSFQSGDLFLGKNYFISKFLSTYPFLGLKLGFLDLGESDLYTASSLNDLLTPGPIMTNGHHYKAKRSSHFWGLGPQLGINTSYFLDHGFNLFCQVATSFLYGNFKTLQKESIPANNSNSLQGEVIKNNNDFHRVVPMVQAYIGLGWQGFINHDKQYLTLRLGYEEQYFWRANQMQKIQDVIPPNGQSMRIQYDLLSEDVTLFGITGEIKLDF